MSSKSHTNTQNVYNPASMSTYRAFQPMLMSQLMGFAQNPLGNSFFQTQAGMAQQNANQLAQRNIATNMRNLKTGGGLLSNSAGFLGAQAQKGTLAASQMGAMGFQNALSNALSNRNWALSSMEGYQPLQTGSNTQQYKTGAGTWLPQVLGAAASMLMPGIGGMLAGTGFASGYGGAAAAAPSVLGGSNPVIPAIRGQEWGPPPTQMNLNSYQSNPYLPYGY